MSVRVTVDVRSIENLPFEIKKASEVALRRTAERGEQLLRREVPKVTRNLMQGVSSDVEATPNRLQAELIVSARTGRRGARAATVHYPSGKTKSIRLRAQAAFDYAEVVATGRPALSAPKQAKAFLIPVASVPANETYITSGDGTFILRPRIAAQAPNPYHERAATALEREIEPIFSAAFKKYLGAE